MIMITIINKITNSEVDMNDTCTRIQLASDGNNAVDRCSCGTVAIHIGSMTVRIDSEELDGLAATILSAALLNQELLQKSEGPSLHLVPNGPSHPAPSF